MAKEHPYVRRVSPMERSALVIHEAHHYHVDGIIEGRGDIHPDRLREAITKAALANPGMRVRLVGKLGFAKWADSGIAPTLHVVEGSDWDGTSERHAEFMTRRLDALNGDAIADVILVRCNDQRLRIVFRSLHAAVDGRGLMHWVAEIFRALRGEALVGSDSTITDYDIQRQYRQSVASPEPAAPPAYIAVLAHGGALHPLSYVWRRIIIRRNVPHLLTKSAVFLAAWARKHAAGSVTFTIPVDYRGLRTDEMSVGNLTGYLRLVVAPDDSPKSLMRQLNQAIRAYADCRHRRGIGIVRWLPIRDMAKKLTAKLDSLLYTANPTLQSGGIVSMGTIRPQWYDCASFSTELFYGIPGFVGKLNVLFVNHPEATVVTFAVPASYNHQGQLDEMTEAFLKAFSA